MRELTTTELGLIVGGYNEDTGGFDESAFEPRATLNDDGTYSLAVTESEYNANVEAAEADHWTIEIELTHYDSNGNVIAYVRAGKASNAS